MAKKRRKKSKGSALAGLNVFFRASGGLFRKAFPTLVILVLAGGLFLGVRDALYADPSLSIQKIWVDPPESISVARRQDLEMRLIGKNILQVDLKLIARELERNPEIQNARIVRHLPSQVSIEIENRKPVALIRFSSRGSFGLISEDGMILDVLKDRTASFLVFEVFNGEAKEPQIGYRLKNPGFKEAIKFVHAFWDHPLARLETVTKISLDHLGNVTITLGEGPDVHLGREPVERLAAIEKISHLLDKEDRKKLDYIDLQFDHIIVKRKK